MQAGIDIGPCVDEAQMKTVLEYIEIGKKEAGAPKVGGNRIPGKGWFVEPTWTVNPRNGQQSFAASVGLLIGIPQR